MTTARSKQICLEQTPWYHVTTRCVRRAFICGYDSLSERDFTHRKQWIEDRLLFLVQVFCIDMAAFAVLSNHYHVVLKINRDQALSLDDAAVIDRWTQLYPTNPLIKRLSTKEPLNEEESQHLNEKLPIWRHELGNISRFMALVNQFIARKSNTEDGCKGRFWEHRFTSQAILDDDALIRTLAYVDLNPVRAGIAATPEASEHTSIHRRLQSETDDSGSVIGLLPFRQQPNNEGLNLEGSVSVLPMGFDDYLALLDWTGRRLRNNKSGHIHADVPDIFTRLNYSPAQWLKSHQSNTTWQQRALGSVERIRNYCETLQRRWIWQATDHEIC